ncbi:hypothetical protein PGTUg99_036115 [Puccinia graminis f. sp. tritici]|uniref:Uncharacterized protein n=1 Tax=Puccinia graminis f. sp. tritici TaxID=56615 RepID=A0A5B0P540_PUCGR|nr:hypothetical protein PGTUg99_036115 [Puccinia graminis f. sp. tritici]
MDWFQRGSIRGLASRQGQRLACRAARSAFKSNVFTSGERRGALRLPLLGPEESKSIAKFNHLPKKSAGIMNSSLELYVARLH